MQAEALHSIKTGEPVTETEIAEYQSANDPARPLDSLSTSKQNRVITEICKQIESAATR